MKIGDNKLSTAKENLEQHIKDIDDYINSHNTKFSSFREEFLLVADLPLDTLKKLTKDELFDNAYILYSYASYIQDDINRNKIALDWCNDQIEKLIVKHNDSFDKYTKHESKKQIIAQDNVYAAKVDQMRLVAESRLQALDGKVYEIKRKADILLEKGKRS
jgi:hypothetical protein